MDATLRSKAEICALLNEFLYLGFKDAGENDTLADIIAANRKILEDVQYHARKLDYDREKEEK